MNQNEKKILRSTHIFLKLIFFFIGYNRRRYFVHNNENNKLTNKFIGRHQLHIYQSTILSIYNQSNVTECQDIFLER